MTAYGNELLPLRVELKVPTFDGHLNESNTDLRRCSMEYTPRRKLTREFKLEAVRQTALSEKPKAQVARELGVRVGQLRTWRLEFEKEAVTGIAKPDRSAAEDLEQLRRENAKLKMEIEILKKSGHLLRSGIEVKYAFVEKNRRQYGVPALCEALQSRVAATTLPGTAVTVNATSRGST